MFFHNKYIELIKDNPKWKCTYLIRSILLLLFKKKKDEYCNKNMTHEDNGVFFGIKSSAKCAEDNNLVKRMDI